MEAFLVFDPTNYVVITNYNKQFIWMLARLAHARGLLESTGDTAFHELSSNSEQFQNVLVILFSPYVASLRILKNKSPSYNLLAGASPNGRISYIEHHDHYFLHLYEATSTREFKHHERRLQFFKQLTAFVFGSNPSSAKDDKAQSNLLKRLFRRWTNYGRTITSMVEAVERLQVSFNIHATFHRLLQYVLGNHSDKMRRLGELPCHAMLFSEDKLLSHHWNPETPCLTKSNMIQLILLLESVNCNDLNESTEYESDFSDSESISTDHESYHGDRENSGSDEEYDSSPPSSQQTVSSGSRIKRRLITPSSSPHSLSLPFNSFVVYLKASETSDILLPYCAVIIRISSSLTLALLSELHVADFTCAVQVVLQTLNNIQYFKSELKGFLSLHKLERAIIKIKAYLKFNQNKSLIKSLDRLLQPDFKKCLLSLEKTELPSMIEALCSSTCSSLRDVYKNLVHLNMRETLLSRYDDKEVIAHLDSLRIYCERRTRDYIDYLEVKTERNMTIEPFMEVSPNLLAFLYIDRVKNEVIYASSDDIGKLAFGRTSKTKDALNVLSDAIELAYTSLASGNLSSKWSIVQKQLHFNYFMWFEDMSGKHLVPEVKEFTLQSYPSVVGSNFINEIIRKIFKLAPVSICCEKKSIACFELLLVEKSSQEKSITVETARKMAAKLWEMTSCPIG